MSKIDYLLETYIVDSTKTTTPTEGKDSQGRIYTWKNFVADFKGFFKRLGTAISDPEHVFYTNKKIYAATNEAIKEGLNSPDRAKIALLLEKISLNGKIHLIDGKEYTLNMFKSASHPQQTSLERHNPPVSEQLSPDSAGRKEVVATAAHSNSTQRTRSAEPNMVISFEDPPLVQETVEVLSSFFSTPKPGEATHIPPEVASSFRLPRRSLESLMASLRDPPDFRHCFTLSVSIMNQYKNGKAYDMLALVFWADHAEHRYKQLYCDHYKSDPPHIPNFSGTNKYDDFAKINWLKKWELSIPSISKREKQIPQIISAILPDLKTKAQEWQLGEPHLLTDAEWINDYGGDLKSAAGSLHIVFDHRSVYDKASQIEEIS